MTVTITVSLTFDLPDHPSPNEAAALVMEELRGRIEDDAVEFCLDVEVE